MPDLSSVFSAGSSVVGAATGPGGLDVGTQGHGVDSEVAKAMQAAQSPTNQLGGLVKSAIPLFGGGGGGLGGVASIASTIGNASGLGKI